MKKYWSKQIFAIVMGFIDGILSVLTLATGRVLSNRNEGFSFNLAIRVSLVTALSGAFVFFISEYSRQRHRLIIAEKELNLTSHGKFAVSNLGKKIIQETLGGTCLAGFCSFLGAFIPISGAVFFPNQAWLSIVVGLLILAILGFSVARLVYGKPVTWMAALILTGILVSFIGYKLHVI